MSTPHISCKPGQIAERVILPGDPKRARRIAKEFLDDVVRVSNVRGNGIYTGTWNGTPMTVMASGMGIPSTMLYATELYRTYGVQRICRVGTCGGIASEVSIRDIVIAQGAHTNSQVAQIQVPDVTVSLTPSFFMLAAAVNQAQDLVSQDDSFNAHVGSVYSTDYFYLDRPDINQELARFGTLAVEMEAAGLYAVAAREHREALAVLTVSDHMRTAAKELTAKERETIFANALQVGVAALLA